MAQSLSELHNFRLGFGIAVCHGANRFGSLEALNAVSFFFS